MVVFASRRSKKQGAGAEALDGVSKTGRPAGASVRSAVVDCAVYVDGDRTATDPDWRKALAEVRERGEGFVWLGMHAPSQAEFAEIAEAFKLHSLAAEDAVTAHQRPKLERYGDTWFLVLKTVMFVEHEKLTATSEVVDTGEIMIFFGADFVIVVRHGCAPELKSVRAALESRPDLMRSGPYAVVHTITDRVVDDYVLVGEALEDDLDKLEAEVFSPSLSDDTERIYQFKRELLEFKHAVLPLERPLAQLLGGSSSLLNPLPTAGPEVPAQLGQYFRDVHDHLLRVRELITRHGEMLDNILQAHLTRLSVQQNTDMRKISAVAAIIAAPTMIAGIYGMNFDHMPELKWLVGYPAALILMSVVCFVLYKAFRRNKWL
jgi:magnesium transporter